jgi:ABC-type transporter Mla subunit MlaD
MEKKRNAFKAGLFIIASILVAFTIIVGIRGLNTYIDPREVRSVSFTLKDDLSGLNVGDDVRVGGFKVGEVRKIEIIPGDDPRVADRVAHAAPGDEKVSKDGHLLLVSFTIPKKYAFHEGASVTVQSTVTGQASINIENLGGRSKPAIPTQVALVGHVGGIGAVVSALDEVKPRVLSILRQVDEITVPTINAVVTNVKEKSLPTFNSALTQVDKTTVPTINATLADARLDIGDILFNVRTNTVPKANATLTSFKQTADHATDLVDEVRSDVKPAADKFHAVGDSAKGMLDEVKDVFSDTKTDIRGTMANMNAATASIKETLPQILEEFTQAMSTIRAIVTENRPQISGILGSFGETSRTLKHAMAELRRAPWRLIWRPNSDDEKNLTVFETARQFASGASDLKDAAEKLQDKLNDKNVDKKEVAQTLERIRASFDKFQVVEKRLWEQVKE